MAGAGSGGRPGLVPYGPPRFFPGEMLAGAVLACAGLWAACALAYRITGAGIEPAGRARAEGRGARNSLLLAAAFSAFTVVFAVFALGWVSVLSLLPAAVVALVLALAAVRRDPLLRLVVICAGSVYALVGLAVSLAKAF